MKIFCVLSYRGAAYQGFERQLGKVTVQGEIEKQLSFLLGADTKIKAAGRTDAKVNALGQTFCFKTERNMENLQSFVDALNRLLPRDIALISARIVPDSFDARHSCSGKRYSYRFSYGEKYPLEADVMAFLGNRRDFDEQAFIAAIHLFAGTHNFQNFTVKKEDKDGFIRRIEIEKCEVDPTKRVGEVIFRGNGFMTYMIRFLIGTAVKAAFHKIEPADIEGLLESKERHNVSFKAPAEGLTLLEVLYPWEK